jgi:hypothetical protein
MEWRLPELGEKAGRALILRALRGGPGEVAENMREADLRG